MKNNKTNVTYIQYWRVTTLVQTSSVCSVILPNFLSSSETRTCVVTIDKRQSFRVKVYLISLLLHLVAGNMVKAFFTWQETSIHTTSHGSNSYQLIAGNMLCPVLAVHGSAQ